MTRQERAAAAVRIAAQIRKLDAGQPTDGQRAAIALLGVQLAELVLGAVNGPPPSPPRGT